MSNKTKPVVSYKACQCDNDAGIHPFDPDTCDFVQPQPGWTNIDLCSPSYSKLDNETLQGPQ